MEPNNQGVAVKDDFSCIAPNEELLIASNRVSISNLISDDKKIASHPKRSINQQFNAR